MVNIDLLYCSRFNSWEIEKTKSNKNIKLKSLSSIILWNINGTSLWMKGDQLKMTHERAVSDESVWCFDWLRSTDQVTCFSIDFFFSMQQSIIIMVVSSWFVIEIGCRGIWKAKISRNRIILLKHKDVWKIQTKILVHDVSWRLYDKIQWRKERWNYIVVVTFYENVHMVQSQTTEFWKHWMKNFYTFSMFYLFWLVLTKKNRVEWEKLKCWEATSLQCISDGLKK